MAKTVTTSTNNKSLEQMQQARENAIYKWDSLGFLDGLKGHVKENIAQLYESEASQLLDETKSPPWWVYIIECGDGSLYTGISNKVSKRLLAHNDGKGAKYTRSRLPVNLKWVKRCFNRSGASKLEHKIKQLTRKEK